MDEHTSSGSANRPFRLGRRLGLWPATSLVVSSIIGVGVFATAGQLASELRDPRLILFTWVLGAVFALAGAACYAELSVNLPRSGGEYVYLREAYGPLWGFAAGWMSLLAGFSAPIAAAAILAARHLRGFVPALSGEPVVLAQFDLFAIHLGPMELTAAFLIALFSALNWFGLRLTGHVQTCLTLLNVLLVAGFVVAGFFLGEGEWSNLTSPPEPPHAGSMPGRVALGLIWVAFSFSGWNAATYVAEEVREPEKTLPRALLTGTAVAAVLYLSLNTLLIYAAPVSEIEGSWRGGSLAAAMLFGGDSGRLVSALVALTLIASASAMLASGPRVYYAMARDGAFFSFASRIHPRWKTPSGAVAVQAFCALAMVFVSLPNLISYIGVSLTFCTVLAVGSLLVMRRRPGWKKLPLVSFAYPALPLACLSIAAMMAFYGVLLKPGPSITAAASIVGGCWLCKRLLQPARRSPIEGCGGQDDGRGRIRA